jgi:UDP-N-acetylmuramyl pentapeptide synthase
MYRGEVVPSGCDDVVVAEGVVVPDVVLVADDALEEAAALAAALVRGPKKPVVGTR